MTRVLWPPWPWPCDTPEQAIALGLEPPDPNEIQLTWDERDGTYEVGKKPNFVRWYDMWHWQFYLGEDRRVWHDRYARPGWRELYIGVFRIHTQPPEGAKIERKHYHGFRLFLYFWLPWEIERS